MYFFNGWIQGIVVAVIITIIVEMILPEGNSKKYIKIVLGIFIVFSIISPIIGEVTGGKFEVSSIINMDKYAKELGIYEERVKDRKIENNNNENIRKIYIEKLEEDINSKLKSKGYNTRKIVVDIEEDDSYAIKDITINIKREREKEEKEKEIKEEKNEIINEVKIEKIIIGKEKEESDESNATIFEKNEITKYISETYGIEENKITVY